MFKALGSIPTTTERKRRRGHRQREREEENRKRRKRKRGVGWGGTYIRPDMINKVNPFQTYTKINSY